jgi:hypothetical protein
MQQAFLWGSRSRRHQLRKFLGPDVYLLAGIFYVSTRQFLIEQTAAIDECSPRPGDSVGSFERRMVSPANLASRLRRAFPNILTKVGSLVKMGGHFSPYSRNASRKSRNRARVNAPAVIFNRRLFILSTSEEKRAALNTLSLDSKWRKRASIMWWRQRLHDFFKSNFV